MCENIQSLKLKDPERERGKYNLTYPNQENPTACIEFQKSLKLFYVAWKKMGI